MGRTAILMLMYVETFQTNVIVFNGTNVPLTDTFQLQSLLLYTDNVAL